MRQSCWRCGTKLDVDGVCPGGYELLIHRAERYATAAQLVHNLGDNVTMTWVRNWSRADRGDRLESLRVGRKVYFRYAHAAKVERDERLGDECRLDSVLVGA